MKAILLAGGGGTRLWPLTNDRNKHLLYVDDKHMITYPLQVLANAGLCKVHLVAGGNHLGSFIELLRSGKPLKELYGIDEKVDIIYRVQEEPKGIGHAIGVFDGFIQDSVAVILGDNIFQDCNVLKDAVQTFKGGAHIFLKEIPDEILYQDFNGVRKAKYGIAEISGDKVVGVEEKPEHPKTRYAVTGAYIFDKDVFPIIRGLKPSARGEIEVTDIINAYISEGTLRYTLVEGEWLDPGDSIESLHEATNRIKSWKKKDS